MKKLNALMQQKEWMSHLYLNDNKNTPILDWALGSQSLKSLLMRMPLSQSKNLNGLLSRSLAYRSIETQAW